MKRCTFLGSVTIHLIVFCTGFIAFDGLAASHSWLGGNGPLWTTGANWTNGAPASGDDLYFVAGNISNRSNYNNYASGTTFGNITFSEGNSVGYTVAGNRIVLTEGIAAFGTLLSIQPQVDMDITLGALQTWTSSRSLAINGQVDLNSQTLYASPSGSLVFNGLVEDFSANSNGEIVKTNTGTLIFSANSRLQKAVYGQSSIILRQGTVRCDGVITNTTGSYSITTSPVGPVVLQGTGTVDAVSMQGNGLASATLSPGDGVPGILHCGLAEMQYGIFSVQINGTNAGTDYSQLVADTATVSAGESCSYTVQGALAVQMGYTPAIGDSYTLINGAVWGAFTNLPYDSILDLPNGYSFAVSYPGVGPSTPATAVTLTAIRAPDSPFLLWKGSSNLTVHTWSSSNSWANGAAPTNGSRLWFSSYRFRDIQQLACSLSPVPPPVQTNDLAGLSVASLLFTGSNYTMYGNALGITEGITNQTSGGTNGLFFDLVTSGPTTFEVDSGGLLQLTGHMNGSGTIHKQGGGELLYTGSTQNSFVGNISVEDGTLRMNGSFLDGTVTVGSGVLTGGGTVSSVTMTAGTLAPGNGPGVFVVQGDLNLSAGSVFQVELNGTSPGSGYDQLQMNGAVNLGGATLDLQPEFAATSGNAFLVLVNDGSDAITGTFAGLPEGALFSSEGQYFSITYKGGSGNDIVITRVNPPASFGSIFMSAPGAVQMNGTGGTNLNYTIQATTNLATKNWINIGTSTTDGTGQFSFSDSNLWVYPQRFFRAVAP